MKTLQLKWAAGKGIINEQENLLDKCDFCSQEESLKRKMQRVTALLQTVRGNAISGSSESRGILISWRFRERKGYHVGEHVGRCCVRFHRVFCLSRGIRHQDHFCFVFYLLGFVCPIIR